MDNTNEHSDNSKDEVAFMRESAQTGTVDKAASYVGQKTEGATAYVGHKAEDAAAYAGQKAEDAACFAGEKAKETRTAAGEGLRSLGQSVRDHGPASGMGSGASSAVAGALDSSGRYLQEEGFHDIADDVTNLVRRNPIPALLIGIGAGYLLARAMAPRS